MQEQKPTNEEFTTSKTTHISVTVAAAAVVWIPLITAVTPDPETANGRGFSPGHTRPPPVRPREQRPASLPALLYNGRLRAMGVQGVIGFSEGVKYVCGKVVRREGCVMGRVRPSYMSNTDLTILHTLVGVWETEGIGGYWLFLKRSLIILANKPWTL